ncbi:Crp/Fnr family transcriptional regulator [Altererythrobacter sp. ZODW24]|uniref:Crp/Fnr family transcriptional regulator n=1 Tax=Altererythrobacter sp. ZODW24 TaxID=2185142 RepID=UPI000DF8154E|nr:Crp/Fnr family transcriptional regulator [Altererythrobacter sp. ZODW24]
MQIEQSASENNLLAGLSADDFGILSSGLVRVDLPRGTELSVPGQEIQYCWFIEEGIASMVASSRDGQEAEAGIVGREGMIDVATFLGGSSSGLRSFMQISGQGLRIPARTVVTAYKSSATIRSAFNLFANNLIFQIAQTALANASYSVEQRLARWLLMCSDRLSDDEIALTHEFLSVMLNVRRAGVTMAVQSLQSAGHLKARRGSLQIVDRPGLEDFASDAYTALDCLQSVKNL